MALPYPKGRWTVYLKFAILKAVATHKLTSEQLHDIYGSGQEELDSWQKLFDFEGIGSLRTTRLQEYRLEMQEG